MRLDQFLAKQYPDHSRSTWQKYIGMGYINVNGTVVDSTKLIVTDDDTIELAIPESTDYSKHELPVVYEDDNVVVVNKPIGVLTHSKGELNDEFTVAEFFRSRSSYHADSDRPGIVHRLDRATSGIIIGAKNDETAKLLARQFQDRRAKKTYYAVLNGVPKNVEANIDVPIGRDPNRPSQFRADINGKSAFTHYEVLKATDKLALVKMQPTTGRTHQLRVHMAYLNTPILGDTVYGKPADRMYLHAAALEITIPDGQRMTFEAEMPSNFSAILGL